MKTILSVGIILLGLSAQADRMGHNGDKFYEETAKYASACHTGECQKPFIRQVLFDLFNKSSLIEPATFSMLTKVAQAQSYIWADTILEGDYQAAGNAQLSEVVGYWRGAKIVGYEITYFEKAWDTSNCSPDHKSRDLSQCRSGRIVESSFVSADGQTYFTDENRLAEFLED